MSLSWTLVYSSSSACRKLTERQKELVVEFAKTENLVDGSVKGVDAGQHDSAH